MSTQKKKKRISLSYIKSERNEKKKKKVPNLAEEWAKNIKTHFTEDVHILLKLMECSLGLFIITNNVSKSTIKMVTRKISPLPFLSFCGWTHNEIDTDR